MANQHPPQAKKIKHRLEKHDSTLIDNYNWIKDPTLTNPDVLKLLEEEKSYTNSILEKSKSLQQKIFQEVSNLHKVVSADEVKAEEIKYTQVGEWLYWEKLKNKDDRFRVRYRKTGETETEEVVLDLNEYSAGYNYFEIERIEYTEDRKFLLFSCKINLNDWTTAIFDVDQKTIIAKLNSDGDYYSLNDESLIYLSLEDLGDIKKCSIKKHVLNSLSENDEILYTQSDNSFYLLEEFQETESGRFLIFKNYRADSCEWWYLDLEKSELEFKCFLPMSESVSYRIYHSGDYFYIITNSDGAYNYKIMRTPVDKIGQEDWIEVVPHRKDKYLASNMVDLGVAITCTLKDYFAYLEFENGFSVIKYINNATLEIKEIEFKVDLPFYRKKLYSKDYNSGMIYFFATSYTLPWQYYKFDIVNKKLELYDTQFTNNYNPEEYKCERVWATASDGVKIPISLFYKKDLFKKDGTNPLLIEGYGSYGLTDFEYFNDVHIILANRGFVYARAHIRGSGYLGAQWFKSGSGENKIRSYNDFVDCIETLCSLKYADHSKIFAQSNSAGAPSIGYIVNNHNKLLKCAILLAPALDDLTAFITRDNPGSLGSSIVDCGNIEVQADFENILSHTPYYNIKKQEYPHIIIYAGLYDVNVRYWEPLKWIQKVREYKTDTNQQFIIYGKFRHGWDLTEHSKTAAYICNLVGIDE